MRYRYFDFSVESHYALPELPEGGGQPDIVVHLEDADLPELPDDEGRRQPPSTGDGSAPYLHRFNWTYSTGEIICSLWRRGAAYRLHYPGFCDFLVQLPQAASGHVQVTCQPATGARTEGLRHVLLSQVLPRILGELGHLLLHASAVELADGRQLVFAGISGQGKSTLAAWFHRQGARLLADDCVRLEEVASGIGVSGAFPRLRLRPDSASILPVEAATSGQNSDTPPAPQQPGPAKRAFSPMREGNGARIKGSTRACGQPRSPDLFLLGDPASEVSVQALPGTQAAMELLRSAFNLDPTDPGNARNLLNSVGRVLALCQPVHELRYPRELERLPELEAQILRVTGRCA